MLLAPIVNQEHISQELLKSDLSATINFNSA